MEPSTFVDILLVEDSPQDAEMKTMRSKFND